MASGEKSSCLSDVLAKAHKQIVLGLRKWSVDMFLEI